MKLQYWVNLMKWVILPEKTQTGGTYFSENPLDSLGLYFYPWKFWIKHSITPENLAKLCYTPWKFEDQKQGHLEILHGFS